MNAANDTQGTGSICQVCRTRTAEKAIPFYCAKSSELRAGAVPIYSFSTPICETCIEERAKRRRRNFWRVSFAIFAVAFIPIFISVWGSTENGSITKKFMFSLTFATLAGSLILFFALIISTKVCSSRFVAVQLAVKDKEKELMAAGYVGFWDNPPKHLTIR